MSWSTGEVGGASGVTMAERTREGGCRTSGGGFSIPLGNDELLLAARLPQQFAITSAHQSKAALHETNRPIARIGGFAGVLGNMSGAEQNFSDHAVSIADHSCIPCVESQRQSLTPLGRLWNGRPDGFPLSARHSRGRHVPPFEIIIQRQLDNIGRCSQR